MIASPIVGKVQSIFGRVNMIKYGLLLVGLPFLGYFLINKIDSTLIFIFIFLALRSVQGIGNSMWQTAIYAILTSEYPKHTHIAVGILETSSGIGLALGPVAGTLIYEVGGIDAPFLTFCIVLVLLSLFLKRFMPSNDQRETEEEPTKNKISYFKLLSSSNVIFANLSVLLSVLQYVFIDPVLAYYLHEEFHLGYEDSAYFFFALGIGNMIGCLIAPLTSKCVNNKASLMISSIFLGVITMTYSSSYVLHLPKNTYIIISGLFLGGLINAYLIIPTMDEMLKDSQERLNLDEDNKELNDAWSGLFNMSYSAGEILGPLIGNLLFTFTNFSITCDIIGCLLILFGFVYFVVHKMTNKASKISNSNQKI